MARRADKSAVKWSADPRERERQGVADFEAYIALGGKVTTVPAGTLAAPFRLTRADGQGRQTVRL